MRIVLGDCRNSSFLHTLPNLKFIEVLTGVKPIPSHVPNADDFNTTFLFPGCALGQHLAWDGKQSTHLKHGGGSGKHPVAEVQLWGR